MIDKVILLTWLIWFFYEYGPPIVLFNFLVNFYYIYPFRDIFNYYNEIIYSSIWDDKKSEQDNTTEIINELSKEPSKYEDKYLDDIRKLSKEWEFTDDEINHMPKLIEDFLNSYIKTGKKKIEEITNQIIILEKEIAEDIDLFNYVENFDDDCENTSEEENFERRKKIQQLQKQYNNIKLQIESEEGILALKVNSEEQAKKYTINKRLDKLKNCYVIEKTPIGNVLMIYEKNRESFKYYSDCNIPYRYLEVVGRKYVKLFRCRPILIDMEEELRLFEEKWDKEQKLKKQKEEEDKNMAEEAFKNNRMIEKVEQKKNIFAKFKSYNKDAGGKISMATPPKNSIPNKSVSQNKENEKILLKERANRYTYEGKFANFNFLQKIDKNIYNKKLGLSFSDFKKLKK